MHRKLISILAAVLLFGGLLAIGAPSALADQGGNGTGNPPASFLPDSDLNGNAGLTAADDADCTNFADRAGADEGTDFGCGYVLSDRFDGTDSLAHLTTVTPSNITRVDWIACPQDQNLADGTAAGAGDQLSETEKGACNVAVGSDNTPKVPGSSTIFTSADKAYDVKWDIPSSVDAQLKDIVVIACVGDGQVLTGSGQNCLQSVEEDILLDDAATGTAANQTSTGEITSYCTRDNDAGPGASGTNTHIEDPCEAAKATNSTESAEVEAAFKPFEHGDPIPNNGFVFRATTSPDIGTLFWNLDTGSQANDDPDTATAFAQCTVLQTLTDRKVWECVLTDANVDDGQPTALWIDNDTGTVNGSGFCNGDNAAGTDEACVLDSHWHVASARAIATVVSTFRNIDDLGGDTTPSGATCASPDKEETEQVGDREGEDVCTTDQFGDPFSDQITLELAGPGEFSTCTGGALHDHNGDGLDEHCHLPAAADTATGQFFGIVNVINTTTPGDSIITVCAEGAGEQGGATGTGNPPPSGHGCADETAKDTQTIHWVTRPGHIHLVFEGTGSEADPCHTGDKNKTNDVGDIENLLACVFDNSPAHNPTTTDQPGGGRLQWNVTTQDAGGIVGTRFVGTPPSETDASGQAIAQLEAFRGGANDAITVAVQDDFGNVLDADGVTKNVTETQQQPACNDGADNDGDGQVDLDDPGCSNSQDNDESGGNQKPTREVASKVSISYNKQSGKWSGDVDSNEGGCVPGRIVKLKKVKSGKDKTIAQDATSNTGGWSVKKKKKKGSGKFYAQVTKEAFETNSERVVCLADKSKIIKR